MEKVLYIDDTLKGEKKYLEGLNGKKPDFLLVSEGLSLGTSIGYFSEFILPNFADRYNLGSAKRLPLKSAAAYLKEGHRDYDRIFIALNGQTDELVSQSQVPPEKIVYK